MRQYTHGGEGRLIQLRPFVETALQLKQTIVENHDPVNPYGLKSSQYVTGVGCHYFSGIDCSNPSCPVFFYDNDTSGEDTTLADCLSLESDSLEEWLSAWLDGEDLWERGERRRGLHR